MEKSTNQSMKRSSARLNKVLLIAPSPPPNGGMAMQAAQLKALLCEEGFDVYHLKTNQYWPSIIKNIKYVRAIFSLIFYIYALCSVSNKYRVWHLFSNSGWSWWLWSVPAIMIGALRKRRVIINFRGGGADHFIKKTPTFFKMFCGYAKSCIVPSKYLEDIFKKYHISTNIIPNIIDKNVFNVKYNHVVENLASEKKIKIVITRNLEAIYNIKCAIFALKKLLHHHPSVHLYIAGSGGELKSLKSLCYSLNVERNVHFLGRLSQLEISELYQDAHVFVNTSLIDNMPNSLLEAMACGVPIVSTNVGGIPFFMASYQHAILIKPDCPQQLFEALNQLIENDSLRLKMIHNGMLNAQQYAWPKVKKQWINVYQGEIF